MYSLLPEVLRQLAVVGGVVGGVANTMCLSLRTNSNKLPRASNRPHPPEAGVAGGGEGEGVVNPTDQCKWPFSHRYMYY